MRSRYLLHQAVAHAAEADPQREAVRCGAEGLTYQQLFELGLAEDEISDIRRATNRGWALTLANAEPGGCESPPRFSPARPRGRPRKQLS